MEQYENHHPGYGNIQPNGRRPPGESTMAGKMSGNCEEQGGENQRDNRYG